MTMYTKGADAAVFAKLRKSTGAEEDSHRNTTLDHVCSV